MAATTAPTATHRHGMGSTRKTALVAGTFYLITFIASMPAAFFFLTPVLETPTTSSVPAPTRAWSGFASSTWSTPLPASAPPSCCSRSFDARMRPRRWGSSPPACSRPPSF